MICPMCWEKHAPFPDRDFLETPEGFMPRNPNAEEKREKTFKSDQIQLCNDPNCEASAISSSCFAT